MSSNNNYYGWDILMNSICHDINDEADIVVALIHWFLTKNAHLRCLGIGDDKTLKPEDEDSELLPNGWNSFQEKYTLRYRFENNLYILIGIKTEFSILVNFLNCQTMAVSNLSLNPKSVIKSTKGTIVQIIPNVSEILNRIRTELIDPVFKGNTKDMETQTLQQSLPKQARPFIHPPINPGFGFDPYGRRDLDPLAHYREDLTNPFGFPNRQNRHLEPRFSNVWIPNARYDPNLRGNSYHGNYFM